MKLADLLPLLQWWAFRHPYTSIGDYMSRWWVVPESWKLPFAIRLHHIKRPDRGPHQHNHPWTFRTYILSGWYVEYRGERQYLRTRGDTATMNEHGYHRITDVSPGGCWTLVVTGRRLPKSWGFDVGGKLINHRLYDNAGR